MGRFVVYGISWDEPSPNPLAFVRAMLAAILDAMTPRDLFRTRLIPVGA